MKVIMWWNNDRNITYWLITAQTIINGDRLLVTDSVAVNSKFINRQELKRHLNSEYNENLNWNILYMRKLSKREYIIYNADL